MKGTVRQTTSLVMFCVTQSLAEEDDQDEKKANEAEKMNYKKNN
jgi:hypothetical protein